MPTEVGSHDGLRGAVVGGGTMGVGIVHAMATHGVATTVVEPDDERARALGRELSYALSAGVDRGKLTGNEASAAVERVRRVRDVADLAEGLDLIVESVPEEPDLKRRVLVAAERRSPQLLASNTSSLSIDSLAAPLRRPDRFLGLHFFNPVWALGLVEVVRGTATSEAALHAALGWVERLGKEAAVVRDTPGFATTRLDLCLALEAIRMVEDSVAAPDHIDRAVRLAYRHPVGPLRLSDIVGLDVRLDIARSLEASLGPRYAPPRLLQDMVAAGDLGRKSGRGFFDWTLTGPD